MSENRNYLEGRFPQPFQTNDVVSPRAHHLHIDRVEEVKGDGGELKLFVSAEVSDKYGNRSWKEREIVIKESDLRLYINKCTEHAIFSRMMMSLTQHRFLSELHNRYLLPQDLKEYSFE